MSRTLRTVALLVLPLAMAVFSPHSASGQATDIQQIKVPELPAFHPRQPKRVELPNGMVVFLQEDHELPLIEGVARIRGGSRSEPAAKAGLANIYGEVWRTGGSKSQTGDQLDDYLEIRAAKVETSGGADSTTISFSCLKADFNDVFKAFDDLLRNPEFREDKLDLAKREAFDYISRRNDEVDDIAGRESLKLAYGAQNPYARAYEYATVTAITRQDLIDWHKNYVHPNDIILGIVGDFDAAAMEAKLRQAYGSWPKGLSTKESGFEFKPAKAGVYQIVKADVNQSSIRMVGLGTTRKDPDYYALQVFNEAFGGGFSSRLFQSIRTAQGLAYAVGGGIGSGYDHPGVLRLVVSTKSQTTVEAIQALYKEIDKLKSDPISDAEIQRAKDSILNSFVFNFDSPDKVLREKMAYEFYGYPLDFLEKYRDRIEKVTAADVAKAEARLLHKDQLAVLVVGNAEEFDKPLSTLGTVTNLDITIPPPPQEPGQPAASPESSKPTASNAEGKALAAKVVTALGGEARLKSVAAISSDLTLTQKSAEGDSAITMHTTVVFPDQMRADLQTPQGQLSIVVSPQAGFMSAAGQGVHDMPASQRKDLMEQIHRDPVFIAQHVNDPAFIFAAGDTKKIGDIETRIVDVSGAGMSIRWFVDPATGRIVSETYEGMGRSGPFQGQTDFQDWKTFDGINLPTMRLNKQDGKDSSSSQYTAIKLNPQVDPKLFQKPAAAVTQ